MRRTRNGWSGSLPSTAAGGTGAAQYGQACQIGSSGAAARGARLLEAGRADRADEERCLDLAAADGAAEIALGEPLLERPVLEVPVAPLLDRVGGTQEEVDDRPDEGRHEPEHAAIPTSQGSSMRRRASL